MDFESGPNKERLSERNKEMLRYLGELDERMKERGVNSWVVGGWALEGMRREVTREHHDLDYLVDARDREKLIGLLEENGFEIIEGQDNGDGTSHEYLHKIIGRKGDIDADFVFIRIDEDKQEARVQAYDEFVFPTRYLEGGEASIDVAGIGHVFHIAAPELLYIAKRGDERSSGEDVEYLRELIGEEEIEKLPEDGVDYEKFRRETTVRRPGNIE